MEAEAPIVLARWVYYGAVMILFGSSLFPLYALAGRDPTPALLPRAVNVTLAVAALVAAFGWLLGFTATLVGPDGWADTLQAILLESSFGTVWIVRLIPTRVKADSFRGFQTGASQIPWRRTGGSPCGQGLHFVRTMT